MAYCHYNCILLPLIIITIITTVPVRIIIIRILFQRNFRNMDFQFKSMSYAVATSSHDETVWDWIRGRLTSTNLGYQTPPEFRLSDSRNMKPPSLSTRHQPPAILAPSKYLPVFISGSVRPNLSSVSNGVDSLFLVVAADNFINMRQSMFEETCRPTAAKKCIKSRFLFSLL